MTRILVSWAAAALVIFLFWSVSSRIQREERDLNFSEFMTEVEAGTVERVIIEGDTIVGNFTDGQGFKTVAPPQVGEGFIDVLRNHGVDIRARDASSVSWVGHIISWLPILILLSFLAFFIRQLQSSSKRPQAWSDDQRREMKLSILYRLADKTNEVSEEDIVSALVEPGRPSADALRVEVRRALYEMLSDGTVELTSGKQFRAKSVVAQRGSEP